MTKQNDRKRKVTCKQEGNMLMCWTDRGEILKVTELKMKGESNEEASN